MPSSTSESLPTIEGDVWFYHPNMGASVFFALNFFLINLGMGWRFFWRGRLPSSSAFFCVVQIGLLLEIAGFGLRVAATTDLASVSFFAAQASLIVLAPLFIAAGNYLCITQLICSISGSRSTRVLRIPARWITKIFVACDILTILVQCSGTSISAGSDWVGNTADIGSFVLVGGLALQTLTLCFFIVILLTFGGMRLFRVGVLSQPEYLSGLRSVLISSVAIWFRCVYRLVEHATGYDGYLFTHEWMFYVLEAVPMVIAAGVFVIFYPPSYVAHAVGNKGQGTGRDTCVVEA